MQDEGGSAEQQTVAQDGLAVLLLFGAFLGFVTAMFGPPDLQLLALAACLGFAGLAGIARLPAVRRWRARRSGHQA